MVVDGSPVAGPSGEVSFSSFSLTLGSLGAAGNSKQQQKQQGTAGERAVWWLWMMVGWSRVVYGG